MKGIVDSDPVSLLQKAAYIQADVNRIVWKLNELMQGGRNNG